MSGNKEERKNQNNVLRAIVQIGIKETIKI
jgi:hypothetical protein